LELNRAKELACLEKSTASSKSRIVEWQYLLASELLNNQIIWCFSSKMVLLQMIWFGFRTALMC